MLPLGLNSYPLHYRTAFACSLLLYPPLHRLASRLAFPVGCPREKRRAYHVPSQSLCGLGRASPPVVHRLRRRSSEPPDLTTYLLVQAIQHLALGLCDDVYSASPELTLPHHPGSQPPLMLGVAASASRPQPPSMKEEATLSRELRTHGSP